MVAAAPEAASPSCASRLLGALLRCWEAWLLVAATVASSVVVARDPLLALAATTLWRSMVTVLVGLFFLLAGPRLPASLRLATRITLLPMALWVICGSLPFPLKTLFPFVYAIVLVMLAVAPWIRARRLALAVLALLLLPLGRYTVYAAGHIRAGHLLRTLPEREVSSFEITPMRTISQEAAPPRRIEDPAAVARIAHALERTWPHVADRERIEDPWRLTVHLASGETMDWLLGRSPAIDGWVTWVEREGMIYRNPDIAGVLAAELGRPLWSSSPAPPQRSRR